MSLNQKSAIVSRAPNSFPLLYVSVWTANPFAMDTVNYPSRRPHRHPYSNEDPGDHLWRQPTNGPMSFATYQNRGAPADPNYFSAYDRERITNAIKVGADLRLPATETPQPSREMQSPAFFPARHAQAPTLAFLSEPHNHAPTPSKPRVETSKSTFSVDDDRSVSIKSKSSTTAGGARILKRVMKELTGGVKEPENRAPVDSRPKKEKLVVCARGLLLLPAKADCERCLRLMAAAVPGVLKRRPPIMRVRARRFSPNQRVLSRMNSRI